MGNDMVSSICGDHHTLFIIYFDLRYSNERSVCVVFDGLLSISLMGMQLRAHCSFIQYHVACQINYNKPIHSFIWNMGPARSQTINHFVWWNFVLELYTQILLIFSYCKWSSNISFYFASKIGKLQMQLHIAILTHEIWDQYKIKIGVSI